MIIIIVVICVNNIYSFSNTFNVFWFFASGIDTHFHVNGSLFEVNTVIKPKKVQKA